MALSIVVVNPASTTHRHCEVEAECLVIGVFSSDRDARRFVKTECRENGDKEYCVVAELPDVVELKPRKTKFEAFAAKYFQELGDKAPEGWQQILEDDESASESESESESEEESSDDEEEAAEE